MELTIFGLKTEAIEIKKSWYKATCPVKGCRKEIKSFNPGHLTGLLKQHLLGKHEDIIIKGGGK